MMQYVEVPEVFRVLAEKAAELREKEYGPPCLALECPHRRTRCSERPANVVPFRRKRS